MIVSSLVVAWAWVVAGASVGAGVVAASVGAGVVAALVVVVAASVVAGASVMATVVMPWSVTTTLANVLESAAFKSATSSLSKDGFTISDCKVARLVFPAVNPNSAVTVQSA